ncbi:MAG: hydrogen peroxide-inducible genes activator [Cytophagaceae bacterium]|nr:hydrogen peroxide-inducible genes activator [Cytophagaceae bacterium]
MTIQQLEYLIAVDECRHFAKAAEKCFVTQPTLSMMLQKLEEEWGVQLFDRSRQPVVPTKEGEELIRLAKNVILETKFIKDHLHNIKDELTGEVRLAIIPTLAPYLVPLFLNEFVNKAPKLKVFIREMATVQMIAALNAGTIDIGIMATPIDEPGLKEYPLFYEEFYVYASPLEKLPQKKYILPKEIKTERLWLLEEGHCFRNQMMNLCQLKKKDALAFNYEAGSIETLINLVDHSKGLTLIPQLAEMNLTPAQRKNVREFTAPKPARQISLVVKNNFIRQKMITELKKHIQQAVDKKMLNNKNKKVTAIE